VTVSPSAPAPERSGGPAPTDGTFHPARENDLWERVFSRDNLSRALRRVERNRGAPGVDGMGAEELRPWLHLHWPELRRALDEGTYRPAPVRQVTIPKPDGGQRLLGVPTVLDRLIQQAILQVLTPIYDPAFSESSFGFRPRRSAHQAVYAARGYVQEGFGWVVDVDLDRFFDRVGHDALMARVARRVGDARLLKLIRRYLDAGIMVDGVKQPSAEGTPQGSPLSPLLSNVMLDDLDRELERRGHRFVRYADDIRVYVRSERAAARVLDSVGSYVEGRLKLKVNRQKSSVAPAATAVLLGFGFFFRPNGDVAICVDPKALKRLRLRLKALTRRAWSVAMDVRIRALNRFTAGWCAYFALSDSSADFAKVDKWVHRRLRAVRWKEWKAYKGRRRNLVALGIPEHLARQWAASQRGAWRLAASPPLQRALPGTYWARLGLQGFVDHWRRLRAAW
jgi:RNA-directed DNA polymerase